MEDFKIGNIPVSEMKKAIDPKLSQQEADAIYDEFEFVIYDKDLSTEGIKLMRLKEYLNSLVSKDEWEEITLAEAQRLFPVNETEISKRSFKKYVENREIIPSPFMISLMRSYFSYLDQNTKDSAKENQC